MGKKSKQLSDVEQNRLKVLQEYIAKAEWAGNNDFNTILLDSRVSDMNGKEVNSDTSFAILSGRNDNNLNELDSVIVAGSIENANNIAKFNLSSYCVILNLDTGEIISEHKESMRPTKEMLLKAIGREDFSNNILE